MRCKILCVGLFLTKICAAKYAHTMGAYSESESALPRLDNLNKSTSGMGLIFYSIDQQTEQDEDGWNLKLGELGS